MSRAVPRVRTAEGLTTPQWEARQRDALYLAGARMGSPGVWLVGRLSAALVALWRLESGAGDSEDNFNAANLRAFAWDGPVFERGGVTWRSYEDPEAFAFDALLSLVKPGRYHAATWKLVADGDGWAWYRAIRAAGYTPGSSPSTLALFDRLFSAAVGAR